MAFEDKMKQLKATLPNSDSVLNIKKGTTYRPRVSKSYTLKPDIAEELATRAQAEELTASRYLEKLLRTVFRDNES
jgi:hypothetical protein